LALGTAHSTRSGDARAGAGVEDGTQSCQFAATARQLPAALWSATVDMAPRLQLEGEREHELPRLPSGGEDKGAGR
jgi:hypothetical protein